MISAISAAPEIHTRAAPGSSTEILFFGGIFL